MINLLIPNKTDEAASKSYIAQSLISFLKDKDIDNISITDIVKKAGVSRMTYYRYFSSKIDVLESYLDIVFKDYILTLDKAKLTPLILNKMTSFLNDKFCKNTESNIDTIYIAYYAGGIFNIYINWLKKEIIATEEELAEKIHNITNSFMY